MELQYGHTMRLHHLDFPDPTQAVQSVETGWEQTNPSSQLEVKTPVRANQSFSSTKVNNTRFLNAATTPQNQEIPQGGGTNNSVNVKSIQGCQSIKPNAKNAKNTANSGTIQTNFSRRISVKHSSYGHGQPTVSSISIEWDVLDSFQEFATFLELQNPICPAELLDTPEKLMNVLSWDV